ncbi:pilus assembly protein PilP [Pseudomonas sp. S04]|uniref:type 4a pilus biogenesis protein PilO n=1 Tax=unclassified Pseudomonas TaxID=196821 RepID=UPI0013204FA9|nr:MULTISPECIES: type 4a pilus biogenesis protein PilO [unclassified Pseudomonas]QHC99168.1 pilus assembly protein PilP [Pseudomonas sp. S04]QHF31654.1 pilus assembly protein PilP [Pseudomonas sp. S19]
MRRLPWLTLDGLDMHNMATWPALGKALLGVLLMVLLLVLGYSFYLRDLQARLVLARAGEDELKQVFVSKAHQAAHLQPYLEQMRTMQSAFATLLRQLPGDTEMPGLLEDISRAGSGSGLELEEIKLLPEVNQPFYVELPIQISATGAYHDLAAFVSAVSALPRIVTLHDFSIRPLDSSEGPTLRMNILARTYRSADSGQQP